MRDGAIVLAGGRSARMGRAKADLEWHGTTFAYRVAGLLYRCVDGPVVVVRAPGQRLPELPVGVLTTQDAVADRGPLQGIAAGLAVLEGAADVAFVAAVDAPLLHPEFVTTVLSTLTDEHDVALPVADGRAQPLAAAYRVSLRALVEEVAAAERRGTAALFARCRVRELAGEALPYPESMTSLNDPGAYARARAQAAPSILVEGWGVARAATLGALGGAAPVRINGAQVAYDERLPLAHGDAVQFGSAEPGRPA